MKAIGIAVILTLLFSFVIAAQSVISDRDTAMSEAEEIWGSFAKIATTKKSGEKYWRFEVGCDFDGEFIVVGEGRSWKEAFRSVDKRFNGPTNLQNGKKSYSCIKKNKYELR